MTSPTYVIMHSRLQQVRTKLHLIFTGWGWSGGAMVQGKLPVPGRPTNLD